MKLVNSYGSNQTRASIIEHKIRKVVEDKEQIFDPEFYKSLRERLESLIAEQAYKFADAQEFKRLQMLLDELFAQDEKSKTLGFNVRV